MTLTPGSWALRLAYWLLDKKPPPEAVSEPVPVVTLVRGEFVQYEHMIPVPDTTRGRFAIDPKVKEWTHVTAGGDVWYEEPAVDSGKAFIAPFIEKDQEEVTFIVLEE